MATNMVQEIGNTLQYTNGSGTDASAGDLVAQGNVVGICVSDVANGDSGPIYTEGVFLVPANGTIGAAGVKLYLDATNKYVDPADGGSDEIAGSSWEAKSATKADYVKLKLLGSGDVS